MRQARQRRIVLSLLLLMTLFAVLTGRLMWIQLIDAGSFSRRGVDLVRHAVAQRETGIVLDSGRGHFYDRNGQPITGDSFLALAVFPTTADMEPYEREIGELTNLLHIRRDEWDHFLRGLKQPSWWTGGGSSHRPVRLTESEAEIVNRLAIPGVKAIETVVRYPEQMAAKHLIGYIGQNPERIQREFVKQLNRGTLKPDSEIGNAGLEKTFEPYLQGIGKVSLSLFTDASRRPLSGLQARLIAPDNPYYPLKVTTTLDLRVQRGVESLLDRFGVRQGAVVVLDAENADVIAMASRPDYDPYDVDPEDGRWNNRALKAIAPGSVFKTVVAAAALEEGVARPDETFHCDGTLGQYGFTCWLKSGHGHLTFEEAFAESCNIVFAQVVRRLTGAQVQSYAQKLGLIGKIGWAEGEGAARWEQFDAEEVGRTFVGDRPSEDDGVLVQTAIGQRDVRITPLQAANMVVTLLNGGEVASPRVVKDVRYRNGAIVRSFPERTLVERGEGISGRTGKRITRWMEEVVEFGTGVSLQSAKWKLAGKSGTAETTYAGKPAVNQWFVGFGPAERPRYAVAVVAENVPENDMNRAVAVFRGVMDMLAEMK